MGTTHLVAGLAADTMERTLRSVLCPAPSRTIEQERYSYSNTDNNNYKCSDNRDNGGSSSSSNTILIAIIIVIVTIREWRPGCQGLPSLVSKGNKRLKRGGMCSLPRFRP